VICLRTYATISPYGDGYGNGYGYGYGNGYGYGDGYGIGAGDITNKRRRI